MGTHIVLLLVLFHFIADFIFQDEEWALGKSKSFEPLLKHTITYSLLMGLFVFSFTGLNLESSLKFMWVTFFFHTLTDYISSKYVSKKFEKKELGSSIPNLGAFTYIGADQVAHYFQLFLTYKLLTL